MSDVEDARRSTVAVLGETQGSKQSSESKTSRVKGTEGFVEEPRRSEQSNIPVKNSVINRSVNWQNFHIVKEPSWLNRAGGKCVVWLHTWKLYIFRLVMVVEVMGLLTRLAVHGNKGLVDRCMGCSDAILGITLLASSCSTSLLMDLPRPISHWGEAIPHGMLGRIAGGARAVELQLDIVMAAEMLGLAIMTLMWQVTEASGIDWTRTTGIYMLYLVIRCINLMWSGFAIGSRSTFELVIDISCVAGFLPSLIMFRGSVETVTLLQWLVVTKPSKWLYATAFWAKLAVCLAISVDLRSDDFIAPAPGADMLIRAWWLASVLLLVNVLILLLQWPKPLIISGMFFVIPAVACALCWVGAASAIALLASTSTDSFQLTYLVAGTSNMMSWFWMAIGQLLAIGRGRGRLLEEEQPALTRQDSPVSSPTSAPRLRSRGASGNLGSQLLVGHPSANERPLRILCLDGGGIRGVNLVLMLSAIEQRCQRPINELFDLICGTSIGGCIAAACATGLRTPDVMQMMESLTDMFATSSLMALLTKGSRISAATIEYYIQLLIDRFYAPAGGLKRLKQRVDRHASEEEQQPTPHFFCVASEGSENDKWEPFVLSNYPRERLGFQAGACGWPLFSQLRATTAAPTFFPSYASPETGKLYVDGAICANNPAMLALHEAKALWPGRSIGCMVSMGTGRCVAPLRSSKNGLTYWAGTMLSLPIETWHVHKQAQANIQLHNPPGTVPPCYFRIDPIIPDVEIDESRRHLINQMKTRTAGYIVEEAETFDRLCAALLLLSGQEPPLAEQMSRLTRMRTQRLELDALLEDLGIVLPSAGDQPDGMMYV